jgi:hypothetical protein
MSDISNIISVMVRKRLKRGAYEYPDLAWVQKYNDKNHRPEPGRYSTAPSAAWWWSMCCVADFYKIDPDSDAMVGHLDEARALYSIFVMAKAPGTEAIKAVPLSE